MAKPSKTETSTAPQGAATDAPSDTAPAETTALAAPDKAGAALATVDPMSDLDADDVGGGFENQTNADRKISWLVILQPGSPDVASGKFRAGDVLDTVTGKVYDGKIGVVITPAVTDRKYVLTVDANHTDKGRPPPPTGTKFRGQFDPMGPEVKAILAKAGKTFGKIQCDTAEEPRILQETFYMPSVLHDPDTGLKPVMIGHKSSSIKPYQELSTAVGDIRVNVSTAGGDIRPQQWPLYGFKIRMTTEIQTRTQNGQKQTWYTPVYRPAEGDNFVKSRIPKTDPAFQAGKQLKESFLRGSAKVDYNDQHQDGADAAPSEDAPF